MSRNLSSVLIIVLVLLSEHSDEVYKLTSFSYENDRPMHCVGS